VVKFIFFSFPLKEFFLTHIKFFYRNSSQTYRPDFTGRKFFQDKAERKKSKGFSILKGTKIFRLNLNGGPGLRVKILPFLRDLY